MTKWERTESCISSGFFLVIQNKEKGKEISLAQKFLGLLALGIWATRDGGPCL